MQIEIAKMERMSQTGSSLLRLIQNSYTPALDLLIRESVQNSIDAAVYSKGPIKYDVSTREFNKSDVIHHFTGIEENLNSRYKDESQTSIVVRDSNTTGLTGPLHQDYIIDGDFGNLLKLVYEISMPQEKEGAGGSWGLGKTVYFRVGMGLVIYYSRIEIENGEYESRLAACLIEDETKENTLLPDTKNIKRGIAWWGKAHTKDSTRPITDQEKIKEILNNFNVKEYIGNETGTTVIIPFIDENMLIPKNRNIENLWWYSNIDLYLLMALQRWYAPRIDNKSYPYGKYLMASVNGELIKKENMEPIYSIINTLYTTASNGKTTPDNFINDQMITTEKIELWRTLQVREAGKVAFTKVNRDILKMGVPDNKKSPYEYIDLEENGEENPPILLYLRKPGMVVNYETHGKWVNGIENTSEDEYIIGIFVPNSENIVTSEGANIELDEYLRQGEKADHSSWSDIMIGDRRLTIVDRIQRNVSNAIKKVYNSKEEDINASRSGALSKSLAKWFLPPVGFGNAPRSNRSPKTKQPRGTRKRSGNLQILQTYIDRDDIIMDFFIKIPNNREILELELRVDTEGGKKFKGNNWEKETELGTEFPVEIVDFTMAGDEDIKIHQPRYISTKRFGVNYKIRIYCKEKTEFKGSLRIRQTDPMVQSSIREYIS